MSFPRSIVPFLLAAALVLPACGDKGPKGASGGGAAAPAAEGRAAARPAASVPDDLARLVPADAMGVVYVPSIDGLAAKIRAIVAAVDADAAQSIDAADMIKDIAGPAADQVDRSRAAAMAFAPGPDPESKPAMTMLLPVRDGAKAKAAFGEPRPGRPAPVVVGSYLAMSQGPGYQPPAAASPLMKDLPAGDLALRVDLARVIAVYGKQIDEAMGEMSTAGARGSAGAAASGAADVLKGLQGALKTFLDSAERLDVAVRVEGTKAALDVAFLAKAGSPLDRPKGARGDGAALAACLPQDYPVVAVLGAGMKDLLEWTSSLSDAILSSMPEKQRAPFKALMGQSKEMVALLGDGMAFGLRIDGSGIEGVEILSAKDPKAYIAKMDEMMRAMDASMLAEVGMAFEPRPPATVGGVEVREWAMKFDWEKMMAASGQAPPPGPEAAESARKMVESIFGPGGMRVRVAGVGERVVVAIAGADDLMARAVAAAKSPGKPPAGIAALLAEAGGQPSFLVSVELRGLIAGVLDLVRKAMPAEKAQSIPPLPAGEPVPLTIHGSGSGREYRGSLSVDVGAGARLVKGLLESMKPAEPHGIAPGEK